MASCRMLRSYSARHLSYNPTIIEAISIAWATPGLFAPVRVGAEIMQEELISAVDGFNNPTIQAVKEVHEAFGKDQRMSCLLSLGVGRPSDRSLNANGHHIAQRTIRDTEGTADHLRRLYAGLQIYFRFSVDRRLDSETSQLDPRLASHTAAYLDIADVTHALNRCVRSSLDVSNITIEHLCEYILDSSYSSCLTDLLQTTPAQVVHDLLMDFHPYLRSLYPESSRRTRSFRLSGHAHQAVLQ